jgi:hypothetical protein
MCRCVVSSRSGGAMGGSHLTGGALEPNGEVDEDERAVIL